MQVDLVIDAFDILRQLHVVVLPACVLREKFISVSIIGSGPGINNRSRYFSKT